VWDEEVVYKGDLLLVVNYGKRYVFGRWIVVFVVG
jgi:hypothetical protein